jgi:hypothetical protein
MRGGNKTSSTKFHRPPWSAIAHRWSSGTVYGEGTNTTSREAHLHLRGRLLSQKSSLDHSERRGDFVGKRQLSC